MDMRSPHVSWHLVLASTLHCLACAPTPADARAAADVAPDASRVRVAPVDARWARLNDAVCDRCGHLLADSPAAHSN
jgi:hypothetical protein